MSIVYFLQIENNGPIKIGVTARDVEQRVIDLQGGCPWRIHIIGSRSGEEVHEKWLHLRFDDLRMLGEWFKPAERLKEAIRETLADGFDWPVPAAPSTPISMAISIAGSEAKLAGGTGFSQVAINKAKRKGHATAEMALAIHRFLDGAVTASAIRPDIWATPEDAARAAKQKAQRRERAPA